MEFPAADENIPVASYHWRRQSRSEIPKVSDENLDCSPICSDVTLRLKSLSLRSIKFPKSGVDDLLSATSREKNDFNWLLAKESKSAKESSRGRPLSTRKASKLAETKQSSIPNRSTSVTRSPTTTTASCPLSGSALLRSRSLTPSKLRSSPRSCSFKKTKPIQNSRPSTPISKSQSPVSSGATSSQPNSHSSTPPPPTRGKSIASSGRSLSTGRLPARSQVTRTQTPQQPIVLPQKSPRVPLNLKGFLPSRSVSTGRIKPGATKVTSEAVGVVNTKRRNPSPVLERSRLVEASLKSRVNDIRHAADRPDSRKAPNVSNTATRKSEKPVKGATEGAASGRTVSKSSLDMAIRHLDKNKGKQSSRPFSNAVYPHSVRAATCNVDSVGSLSASAAISSSKGSLQGGQVPETPDEATYGKSVAKLSETDIFQSGRFEYDMFLLKDDVKNTNWLHSVDDISDQGIVFDSEFESLPELFDPVILLPDHV